MDLYAQVSDLVPAPGCGLRSPAGHGIVRVVGSDAREFLHRLCSQDVVGLAVGAVAPAAFLTAKGKLVATAAIAAIGADEVAVEVPDEGLDAVAELLERYHFTERLTIERPSAWASVGLLGPTASSVARVAPWTCRTDESGGLVLSGERFGVGWVRRHGPGGGAPADLGVAVEALSDDLAECLRILGGIVRIGVDADGSNLALEAGLDDHVSTTKGCYTGQEIVARIHTYGHVNRRLVLLRIDGVPDADQTVLCEPEDGDAVGRVTSFARVPGAGIAVALGYVPEAFAAGGSPLRIGAVDGPAATVTEFGPLSAPSR